MQELYTDDQISITPGYIKSCTGVIESNNVARVVIKSNMKWWAAMLPAAISAAAICLMVAGKGRVGTGAILAVAGIVMYIILSGRAQKQLDIIDRQGQRHQVYQSANGQQVLHIKKMIEASLK